MSRSITAEDALRFRFVSDPRLSPDGDRIVFTEKWVGEKGKYQTRLSLVDVHDQSLSKLTSDLGNPRSAAWLPDGTGVIFIADRKPSELAQLFLLPLNGGEAQPVTDLPEGALGEYRISPNGQVIAFSYRETRKGFTKKDAAERKESGASDPPRITESFMYKMDGDGYFMEDRYSLWVVDLSTGEAKELFKPGLLGDFSFDWLPASDRLAVAYSHFEKNYSLEKRNEKIAIVKLDGSVNHPEGFSFGEKSEIRVSPNGEMVAYFSFESDLDDRGDFNRRLYVAPISGGTQTCLTPEDDLCLTTGINSDTKSDDGLYLQWSPDSLAIYIRVPERGRLQVGFVSLAEKKIHRLTEGNHVVTMGNLSGDGTKMSCAIAGATHLMEIGLITIDAADHGPQQLTQLNKNLFEEIEVITPEEFETKAEDGYPVHGWVIRPISPNGQTPGILEVHGGPHMMYGWTFMHEFQLLAAQGYTVVYTNPRGSKGYGEAHTQAIRNAWGGPDWTDVKAAKDWMKADSAIDSAKLAVIGGSYGGYMTNWAVGHTDDFAAAVTDRCVSNLVSKAGNSDYVWVPNGYFQGEFYGGLDSIKDLWEQSPIAYFHRAKTPMLVIHSEGDLRCNIEQSEQVFTALQQRGIPSRFVRYPASTSHGMSRMGPTDLKIHRLHEILAWFKRFL